MCRKIVLVKAKWVHSGPMLVLIVFMMTVGTQGYMETEEFISDLDKPKTSRRLLQEILEDTTLFQPSRDRPAISRTEKHEIVPDKEFGSLQRSWKSYNLDTNLDQMRCPMCQLPQGFTGKLHQNGLQSEQQHINQITLRCNLGGPRCSLAPRSQTKTIGLENQETCQPQPTLEEYSV